jgi:hypothetical protein
MINQRYGRKLMNVRFTPFASIFYAALHESPKCHNGLHGRVYAIGCMGNYCFGS